MDVGLKRKATKLDKKGRKKHKFVKDSTPIRLTNDDYNLLADRMVEVDDETRKKIDSRHIELFEGITDLLQTLCKVVKEVRVVVSTRPSLS